MIRKKRGLYLCGYWFYKNYVFTSVRIVRLKLKIVYYDGLLSEVWFKKLLLINCLYYILFHIISYLLISILSWY